MDILCMPTEEHTYILHGKKIAVLTACSSCLVLPMDAAATNTLCWYLPNRARLIFASNIRHIKQAEFGCHIDATGSGAPRLARPPKPGLDFGFQYALTYKKQPIKKIWGRILGLAWLKFAVAPLRMVDGAKFWITCKQLKLLRKAGHLQLIQNSAPSTIVWRQCDIQITDLGMNAQIIFLTVLNQA